MGYAALVNVPGYLPDDEFGPVFATAAEAWAYLEEEQHRNEAEMADFTPFVASEALTELRRMAEAVQLLPEDDASLQDPAGQTVVGRVGGQRLAFSVIPVDEEPHSGQPDPDFPWPPGHEGGGQ